MERCEYEIYAYGYPCKSAKFKTEKQTKKHDLENIKLINSVLVKVIHHNLMAKYNFKRDDTKNLLHILSKLDDIGFADNYETFDDEFESLRTLLVNRTREIRTKFIKRQIGNLDDKEQKCVAFILDFVPRGLTTPYYDKEKEESIDIPQMETERNLLCWNLPFYKMNKTFHILTGYKLEKQPKLRFRKRSKSITIPRFRRGYEIEEIVLWEFGDIAVKSGIGLWIPDISTARPPNIHIDLYLPKDAFLFAEELKANLPSIENTYGKYLEIEETPRQRILKTDYSSLLESDGKSDDRKPQIPYEKEIEDFSILHPEKIEEGLVS